ncbi:sigma-70 family RNA polymerase sigma factor [Oxynema aestuarii]|uniref:Sigma-70 family RNA polymerase sigma factor n=1 Tax=Oxynema aestuarii AP17 TaxID=2064643 RepID=A0A6H1TT08_9CYAN|nr:sigma-70 family RNA polymerase sigma factor [Oxynema aestuarii]QIZ69346.1 sigma-70 family RNA polymerase sigma factor [Oxynema aestuarii AP17]RMH73586.1 MAG: sigma-70 family RNA polymerase sigma factor [Cyanobacteria bacterium J007]
MQPPNFPECNHSLVKALFHYSDRELLNLFQIHPDEGKYFVAIFCRYHTLVYTLIQHQAKSPVQGDYLFALTWRHIFHELRGLDLRAAQERTPGFTLQTWLIETTALCLQRIQVPPVESIHYSLEAAPPPLWCYLEQTLDQLPPILRLTVLMAQTFHWSETRIGAYLQAEGETLSPADVRALLDEGYHRLENLLPIDIRTIYLKRKGAAAPDREAMQQS